MTTPYINEILLVNSSRVDITNIIISSLETSDSFWLRFNSIQWIEKYQIFTEDIYKLIESLAVADENPLIRSEAVRLSIKYFLENAESLINYLINNEKKVRILKVIKNGLKMTKSPIARTLYKRFLEKYTRFYSIVPEELEFIIDLESLHEEKEIGFSKPLINNHHIVRLDLANWNLKSLPDSIGNLKFLKYLSLWNNRLNLLPKSFEHLKCLEELYLDWNTFKEIPNIDWLNLKCLKRLSITNNPHLDLHDHLRFQDLIISLSEPYLKEGTIQSDVPSLVLIEIITGQRIEKLQDSKFLNKRYACNYKLDDLGHITGLYLYGYHGFQINRIPEEIFSLKHLKELIVRDQEIETLPDNIKNLTNLEKLDLSGNNIRILPNSINELKNLKYLDLEGNDVEDVPSSIVDSNIDLWT